MTVKPPVLPVPTVGLSCPCLSVPIRISPFPAYMSVSRTNAQTSTFGVSLAWSFVKFSKLPICPVPTSHRWVCWLVPHSLIIYLRGFWRLKSGPRV